MNFKDSFLEVTNEFGEDYRTLIAHLRLMLRHHVLALWLQNVAKVTMGKWYSKKRWKSMACIFSLSITFPKCFSCTFSWSKSVTGVFGANGLIKSDFSYISVNFFDTTMIM